MYFRATNLGALRTSGNFDGRGIDTHGFAQHVAGFVLHELNQSIALLGTGAFIDNQHTARRLGKTIDIAQSVVGLHDGDDACERHGEALHVKGIIAHLAPQFAAIPEAIIFPFNIPTIAGFGASAGFNFLLQDRSGTLSVDELGAQTRAYLAEARQRPQLANLFTSFDPT